MRFLLLFLTMIALRPVWAQDLHLPDDPAGEAQIQQFGDADDHDDDEDDRARMRRQMREQWRHGGGFCEKASACAEKKKPRERHLPQMSAEERARFKESLRHHRRRERGGFIGPGPENDD
ncbi:MAG: hypothetical protein LBL69_07150 [Zoogloeaceae bacterium]|nr:hypothetical protein [Zoogloeaceae bacterium]